MPSRVTSSPESLPYRVELVKLRDAWGSSMASSSAHASVERSPWTRRWTRPRRSGRPLAASPIRRTPRYGVPESASRDSMRSIVSMTASAASSMSRRARSTPESPRRERSMARRCRLASGASSRRADRLDRAASIEDARPSATSRAASRAALSCGAFTGVRPNSRGFERVDFFEGQPFDGSSQHQIGPT